MLRNHSFRKANISIAVAVFVMALSCAMFGWDLSDVEYQVVIWGSFASFFVTLFWLYHREDRARERSAALSSDGDAKRSSSRAS